MLGFAAKGKTNDLFTRRSKNKSRKIIIYTIKENYYSFKALKIFLFFLNSMRYWRYILS
jgi:hypothetical protein